MFVDKEGLRFLEKRLSCECEAFSANIDVFCDYNVFILMPNGKRAKQPEEADKDPSCLGSQLKIQN